MFLEFSVLCKSQHRPQWFSLWHIERWLFCFWVVTVFCRSQHRPSWSSLWHIGRWLLCFWSSLSSVDLSIGLGDFPYDTFNVDYSVSELSLSSVDLSIGLHDPPYDTLDIATYVFGVLCLLRSPYSSVILLWHIGSFLFFLWSVMSCVELSICLSDPPCDTFDVAYYVSGVLCLM